MKQDSFSDQLAEPEIHRLTRRDFMKGLGAVAVGCSVTLPLLSEVLLADEQQSRVVLIRDADVVGRDGKINAAVVQRMLDQAVTALLENADPVACWKRLVKPDDVVGIKSNEWDRLPTPPEVERALKQRVMDAGVPERNIGIDDRGVLGHPVFRKCTALINVRPMRTHAWSAAGSLIKNYIMFVPQPEDYHDDNCAPLGAIWHLPHVKGKTRLNVLVMLTPLFYGVGPHHFDKTFVWNYNSLLVGTDPVAVDSIGISIFEARRKAYFGEERPLRASAHHITLADKKYHLGTSDLSKIQLIKLGWKEGVLI
ncbi:MAG TPA: DUF362 domain-containing protein [Candidatus Deferrimicrobium sp.]|nr:DUF362 domain-containing protein [Candidatus Deferrimicrobium sp.]